VSVRFDEPLFLLIAALGIPALWLALSWLKGMSRTRAFTVGLFRAALVALIAAALAGASSVRTSDRVAVVAVVDVSESLKRGSAGDAIEQQRAGLAELARTMGEDDALGVVAFSKEAVAAAAPARGGLAVEDLTLDLELGSGTDLAGAIELAAAMAPPGARTRVVALSDGVETEGDALATASGFEGLRVDVVPIEYRAPGDVIVEYVDAPPRAARESSVRVRVALRSSGPARGTVLLRSGEAWIDVNGAAEGLGRAVELGAGLNIEAFDVSLDDRAVHRLEAIFRPGEEGIDAAGVNNSASAVVVTPGRGRVLLIDGSPGENALAGVLRGAGLELDVIAPEETPSDLLELQAYDLVVLENVAADETPRSAHGALAEYVRELGGGLVVTGGPDALGAGGWNGTDLEPVLPVKLDLPEELIVPSAAIVMVLDSSGSMGRRVLGGSKTQQEIANEAAALAATTLDRTDLVGAIGFADEPYTVLPLEANTSPQENGARLRSIAPGGGTNMYPAIERAGEWLRGVEADVKHVIVLSDGQSQGSPERGVRAARRMREEGISLTTIAVGTAADVQTLRSIADAGGGETYEVIDPNVLPRVFVREIRVVRKPLIRDEPFTPVITSSGSPVTRGLGSPPALGGLVLTQARPEPEIVTGMVAPSGEPVLAHWNTGLGRALVFTSDAGRWAEGWLGWPGYRSMWTQAARYAARPPMSREAELRVTSEGDELALRLEAADEEGNPINLLRAPAVVYTPGGGTVELTLDQTGPGVYEGRVSAPEAGTYVAAAMPRQGDRQLAPALTGFSKSAGLELRSLESDAGRLREIAAATGGVAHALDDPSSAAALWDREGIEPVRSASPLWPLLLIWALGVYVADIATRRVAWDRLLTTEAATARRLAKGATSGGVTGAWRAAKEKSAATTATAGAGAGGAPPEPVAASEKARARVAAAGGETAGGAAESRAATESGERGAEASEPGDAREGLLAAKRRARERWRGEGEG